MNKSKIEWCDLTWNPITGCLKGCHYCYARKMAYRLKGRYGYDAEYPFRPTLHLDRLEEPFKLDKNKPKKIFTCSMGEMFGDWVPIMWIKTIFRVIEANKPHQFIILTKYPENVFDLENDIPWNAWIGVSVENQEHVDRITVLKNMGVNHVKFVSFEPLLGEVDCDLEGIDWAIIGAQTNPYKPPKKEWVVQIHKQAKELDIPVFLKNNLQPIFPNTKLIQEFPKL